MASEPQLVVICSLNPVKIKATQQGFARMFPETLFNFTGLSVTSAVSKQPLSDDETLQGAIARVRKGRDSRPEGNFWVGMEGGVDTASTTPGGLQSFAWIAILQRDGKLGTGRTAAYELPKEIASLVRDGWELGDADDEVFQMSNSKQQGGSVGILTGGTIDRELYYTHGTIMALIPFKNPGLTFSMMA